MMRTCDGTDQNLLRRDGEEYVPCDRGCRFDDVDHRVIWPHELIPPKLTLEQLEELRRQVFGTDVLPAG